jgi:hypothetical protein
MGYTSWFNLVPRWRILVTEARCVFLKALWSVEMKLQLLLCLSSMPLICIEGVDTELHALLLSALCGFYWSTSGSDRFIPEYLLCMSLVRPQILSGRGAERKNSCSGRPVRGVSCSSSVWLILPVRKVQSAGSGLELMFRLSENGQLSRWLDYRV